MFYNVLFFISYIIDHCFSLILASSLPSFNLNLQFTGLHIHKQFYSSEHSMAEAKTQCLLLKYYSFETCFIFCDVFLSKTFMF